MPMKKLFENSAASKGLSLILKINPLLFINQLYKSNEKIGVTDVDDNLRETDIK